MVLLKLTIIYSLGFLALYLILRTAEKYRKKHYPNSESFAKWLKKRRIGKP